jgi:hypothetical protein
MPPPMHFHEENPVEAIFAHRMEAQLKLAELMGVAEEGLVDWVNKYGDLFAELEKKDSDLAQRIHDGTVTEETLSWIRDQMRVYDTGEEEDEDDRIRAA